MKKPIGIIMKILQLVSIRNRKKADSSGIAGQTLPPPMQKTGIKLSPRDFRERLYLPEEEWSTRKHEGR